MNDKRKKQETLRELQRRNEELEKEVASLREELELTHRGTLELYNEVESKNEELRRHEEELSRKNQELAEALEQIKASEEARMEAVRTAAIGSIVITYNHEINNPLAIIYTAVDLLRRMDCKLDSAMESHLDKIRRSAKRIHEVIDKIKEYENLLPKSYINWEMLDLHTSADRNEADPSGEDDKTKRTGRRSGKKPG